MTGKSQTSTNFVERFWERSRGTDLFSISLQDAQLLPINLLMAKSNIAQSMVMDIVSISFKLLHHQLAFKKAKEKSFHTKTTPSSKRRVTILQHGLCGPMRVQSINGRNRTIATACFTQETVLFVIPDMRNEEKTPYHIINARKPSVKFFHIFGSLCYIIRDGENLDKMKEKGDACIFVGYSTQSKAYRDDFHQFDRLDENYYIFATKSRLVAMGYASKGKELNFEYHCTVARLEAVRPGHCKAIYGLKRKHSKRVGYDELQLLVSKRILQRNSDPPIPLVVSSLNQLTYAQEYLKSMSCVIQKAGLHFNVFSRERRVVSLLRAAQVLWSHNAISCSPDPAFPYKAPSMSDITYKRNRSYALSWKPCQGDSLNLPDHRAQVDQGSQIKMIHVKEMMQDNDLKNSKSKHKGSKSRSQSMNEQSRYKQDKTKTRQSINIKSHIFNVKGDNDKSKQTPTRMSSVVRRSLKKETSTLGEIVSLNYIKSNMNVISLTKSN
ncbi:hypothetical protein Tco_0728738 [Tanacetum coccineum]|uniref:Retroviral polymerase SH3-like domain-containing protein n=1 Tax=Tanacetum coccineum TaxID=301880 RepID=A0ABQ4YMU8_9ASTR